MEHNGCIAEEEIAEGWIPRCGSQPETVLVEVEV